MKTRYYIGVSLLCLLGLFHACVQDPTTELQPDNSNEFLNIATAKEYVEWQMVQKTRAHAIKTKGLIPGNFTLLWDKARKSQNENIERFDIPIIPEYTYYALRGEEVNGKMKVRKVRIAQKIVVIKSKNSGKLTSYILTLIPDGDYYSKNKNNFEESFSLNRHHFSGVAIYYDFFARFNVRLDRYVDGQKRAGLYLVCKKEEWRNKRAAIAKKILGPIQIARSVSKMTRSFDEDDDLEPCTLCGDPWCNGDCEEEEWLYCWNCGSPWCNGDCDDDPIIITPDYCSGCGEYEFNCTCHICSSCGNDPCTCDDACSMCGNDPCTCEEWECPNCGDPSCTGNCVTNPDQDGNDTTDENLTEEEKFLNSILDKLKSKNTPEKLLQNVSLDRMEVRKGPASVDGQYGGCTLAGTIYIYDDAPKNLCEIIILEELFHRYQLTNDIHSDYKGNKEIEAKLLVWDYLIEKYSDAYNIKINVGQAWSDFGKFAEDPCERTWDDGVWGIIQMGYKPKDFKTSEYSKFKDDNYQNLKK